jgi:hypothetical protein
MEQVIIDIDSEWHGNTTETLWVSPWFKEDSYQIRNIPFYTKAVSLDDIIQVKDINGLKYFKGILKKSGHSTYRIFLNEKVTEEMFKSFWVPLEEIGCSYEKAYNRFYSIDIPFETDIYNAYSFLQNGEINEIWEFEEGNLNHELENR